MASTYHPIYSGLWNDEALEGTSFECHGFFAFLCSNDHVRPSGIYRMTDAQLVAETRLSLRRVRAHLSTLIQRGRILRDGYWMFVCGYFKRQPKGENLLNGVRQDVDNCSSLAIIDAFGLKYPHFHRWSADRRATLDRPVVPQSIAEQSNALHCSGPSVEGRPASGDFNFELGKGKGQTPAKGPAKGQYLETLKRIERDHPELSGPELEQRALQAYHRKLQS
jgi:hypothetical protein